jgi:hypothetical protein
MPRTRKGTLETVPRDGRTLYRMRLWLGGARQPHVPAHRAARPPVERAHAYRVQAGALGLKMWPTV